MCKMFHMAESVATRQKQQYTTIPSSSEEEGDDTLDTFLASNHHGQPTIVAVEPKEEDDSSPASPPPSPPPPPPPPPPQKDAFFRWVAAIVIVLAAIVLLDWMVATPRPPLPVVAATPRYYQIGAGRRETTSVPVDMGLPRQRLLARDVIADLALHLERYKGTYECLCMHHTDARLENFKRICVLRPHLGLVNPKIIGGTEGELTVREHSVRCAVPCSVARRASIVVEWTDVESLEVFRATLSGRAAVCMQLALDEMEDSHKHCCE